MKSVAILVLSIATLFTASAFGQTPATNSAGASGQTAPAAPPQTNNDRYRDGMVIWETPDDARVPFLLKFNINTQLRYLNTQDSEETFTDHLGVVPAGTQAFQAADHWSTRSHFLRRPTGAWPTTSSAPGSRREPGPTENSRTG